MVADAVRAVVQLRLKVCGCAPMVTSPTVSRSIGEREVVVQRTARNVNGGLL
jgi:hypothetical protein